MKLSLVFSFSLALTSGMNGQTISYEEFKAVIPLLQQENFKAAFDMTDKLLKSTQNDSSDMRGIVTYMDIFSSAGMVALGQMTQDEFKRNAKKYIGQRVVMSAHPCIDSSEHGYNSLQFVSNEGQLQGLTITSNDAMTSILCFEYFKYSTPINPPDFIGKNVRCGGILESVEVNPNKSNIWISRLKISNAFARISTPR